MLLLARAALAALRRGLRDSALALAVVVAVGAVLWLLSRPLFRDSATSTCSSSSSASSRPTVLTGVPIAFAFGLATFGYLALTTRTPLTVVVEPDGRGHVAPHPAGGAAVRVPRPADRDDRHGARDGRLPREPARPRARRAALRAARRDVPRLRHLRLEGRRHGGGGAGAVPRDEARAAPSPATSSRCCRRPARRPRPSRRASC